MFYITYFIKKRKIFEKETKNKTKHFYQKHNTFQFHFSNHSNHSNNKLINTNWIIYYLKHIYFIQFLLQSYLFYQTFQNKTKQNQNKKIVIIFHKKQNKTNSKTKTT